MHADIKGSLAYLKNNPRRNIPFTHKGERISKIKILEILKYADSKGYESTEDLKDEEVETILKKP